VSTSSSLFELTSSIPYRLSNRLVRHLPIIFSVVCSVASIYFDNLWFALVIAAQCSISTKAGSHPLLNFN